MGTMSEIERKTSAYSVARRTLADRMQALEDEVAKVKRRLLPGIKTAAEAAAQAKEVLSRAVEESPELFTKPRTALLHGVRVGYQKGKGRLVIENSVVTVKLIKKIFPAEVDVLVRCVETPVKSALAQKSAAELKRVGVAVEETGDMIVIEAADSEIDKLVEALLKEQEEPEAA